MSELFNFEILIQEKILVCSKINLTKSFLLRQSQFFFLFQYTGQVYESLTIIIFLFISLQISLNIHFSLICFLLFDLFGLKFIYCDSCY